MPRSPSDSSAPIERTPVAGVPVAGLSATVELEVADTDTAISFSSGDVPVLATPRLVALCEEASIRAIDEQVSSAKTSVASRIQFDHLAPVGVGETVIAEATLERVEGRRLIFTVAVRRQSPTQTTLVAAGRITRVLVDRVTFLAKTARGRD